MKLIKEANTQLYKGEWTTFPRGTTVPNYLWTAVCGGNINKVKEYFDKGNKPNKRYIRFGDEHSLIMGALRNQRYDMAKLLMSYGETILDDEKAEFDEFYADALKESLNESTELDRQAFVSLVKLGDKPYNGYSILNDGNFVKRLYADSDEDAISQFRDWIGRGGTGLKESVKLTEGTSNFWSQEDLPLYAFLTVDEAADKVRYMVYSDPEYDEEDDDKYYELEDKYYTELENDGYAVIDLDDGELYNAIDEVNDLIAHLAGMAYDESYKLDRELENNEYSDEEYDRIREEANEWLDASDYLDDLKLGIKSGYYEGAQLYLDGWDKYFIEAVPEDYRQQIVDAYNKIGKDFGLMKLGVAYHASNGETGYNIIKEDVSYTRQQLIDAVKNAYGFTNKEALAWIKKASDEAKREVVNGFRQNARKNFYDESLKESETFTERGRDMKLIKEEVNQKNKYEKLFDEMLEYMEFRLVKYPDGTFGLIDLQGGNLGNIEDDRFDNALQLLDRLDIYYEDYFIRDLEEQLEEVGVDTSDLDTFEDFLQYRDKLPEAQWDFDVLDMVINHPNDIDLNNCYREDDLIGESLKEAKENKIILNDAQKKKVLDYLFGEFDVYTFYKDKLDREWYITDDKSLDPVRSDSDDAAFPMVLVIDGDFVDALTKEFADKITSLKESTTLTERAWRYTLRNGAKLRNAIDLEDGEGIRTALLACYKELLDNEFIDEYDYDDWTEEIRDADWEDEYGDLDDDAIDFELDQLYDLCDNIDVFVALDDDDEDISWNFKESLKEATTPEQRARRRGKLTTPYDKTYTLTLKNKYNYTVIQYRVNEKDKTIEKGLFNWGDGKGSFFDNRKELQRHIDDLLAQGYKMIESKDESLKEDWYHFEYESGANPYIAKSERERDRIIRKYQDRVEDLGNGNYIIHDKEEDLFSVDESIVGKTVSNDGKALGRKLRREFGKGELTGGDNFRFNYQPRRGTRKSIQTEPVDDEQTKIRVASVVDEEDMNESLEGRDRKKFITLLTNELQKEPLAYSRDEANDIAIKRADTLGKNPYDSIEALVKSEVSKTRSKKDESLKEGFDYVFDILVDDDYIDVSDYNDGNDHISDIRTAREVRDRVKKDYPDSKVEISKHSWDEDNHYKDEIVEDTVKQGNNWVNKGKEGTHGKFKTKKAADAQRKAMFANGYKESLKEDADVNIDEWVLTKIRKANAPQMTVASYFDSSSWENDFETRLTGGDKQPLKLVVAKWNIDNPNKMDKLKEYDITDDMTLGELENTLTKLKENVEDKISQDKIMNLSAEEKLETPRGDFKIYKGTWRDFKNEADFDDWGFWFDHSIPEDAVYSDLEKWYKIMHNHKNNNAIAVLYKDFTNKGLKEGYFDTDFDDKKVRKDVVGWWDAVEQWNADHDYPYDIDNGDKSDVEAMHVAMFDMLLALRDEQKDSDEARDLLRRGKRIYNKYAGLSQFTESVNTEKVEEGVGATVASMVAGKAIETLGDMANQMIDDNSFKGESVEEEKKQTPKEKYLAKRTKLKEESDCSEPKEKPEFLHKGDWVWDDVACDWYDNESGDYHLELVHNSELPLGDSDEDLKYVEDMEGFEDFKEELEESLENVPIITNIFANYNID